MNGHKPDNLLVSVVLTLSAGLCIAWLGGWINNDSWWPTRVGMLAICLAIAGGATMALRYNRRQDGQLAERYFDVLWRLDTQAMYTDLADAGLPSLSPDNPWFDLAKRVRETIERLYERIQNLERAGASLEVRCHRAVAEAQRIGQILDGVADPIVAIDHYDDVVLANRSARELLQIDAENTETKALAQLVRCEKLVQLLTATRQHKTTQHRTDEIDLVDPQGQPHSYRATAAKSTDPSGKDDPCAGAVVVLRDIGDQKVVQKRNAEFVAAVSHEMKTPLAGIKAYVELLADGDAEDEKTREEFLGVIGGEADRLQRLVDNLLNLARIEAGVVHVSKQPRSLNEVLEESLRVVQPSAEAKQIELVADLSPLYLGVLADRDMLLQAAINLLSNAVKYTPRGGKVTLRSRLDGDQIRFEVQDTGVGMSEEDCRRVFERFYRVKKDQRMASGTGLGLPLAKHVVEDVHGGRLAVESVLGRGSTFIVTLPSAGQMRSEG
jgi:two-component system, OmpR family, phosphate regulon sensor histidine kinase PhoR